MTRVNFFSVLLIISAIVFLPVNLFSRVSIGSTDTPQSFSVLELFSNETMGLRLPQLTTIQRDALTPYLHGNAAALGLQIFNTTDYCVETWSGSFWISICDDVVPPVLTPPHFNTDCVEDPVCVQLLRFASTVRQLNDGMPQPFTAAGVSFNMMPVTGGVFYVGAQSDDNLPNFDPTAIANLTHKVGVSSFYIGQHVVTNELFTAVMELDNALLGLSPISSPAQYGTGVNLPRNNVSWYKAIVFMNRLSVIMGRTPVYSCSYGVLDLLNPFYIPPPNSVSDIVAAWNAIEQNRSVNGFRFPTCAEWEYAARGGQLNEYTRTLGASGTQFRWSGSNDAHAVAWHNRYHPDITNALTHVQPVGGLLPNQLGIFDMSGNVFEWVWDWSAARATCCAINPAGPDSGSLRILRGGSWLTETANTRVSTRFNTSPYHRNPHHGFRIVASAW